MGFLSGKADTAIFNFALPIGSSCFRGFVMHRGKQEVTKNVRLSKVAKNHGSIPITFTIDFCSFKMDKSIFSFNGSFMNLIE